MDRDAWSIHYNAASDDSIFCGDGGDYAQVAKSKNGQWIELFSPRETPAPDEIDQTGLVQTGFLKPVHLVDMAKHNYLLEPNVRFSPDHKLVIFTSNMLGPSYIYAVEVAKGKSFSGSGSGRGTVEQGFSPKLYCDKSDQGPPSVAFLQIQLIGSTLKLTSKDKQRRNTEILAAPE